MLLDAVISILVILFGFWAPRLVQKSFNRTDRRILTALWLFHLLISFTFVWYVNTSGGDAIGYWMHVKRNLNTELSDYLSIGIGTNFMNVFNYFPSKILDLSFITGSLLYALIGFLGIILLYDLLKTKVDYNTNFFGIPLFPWILFLPNLHFWSVGVGKDSLLFFCVILFFYALQSPRKYFHFIIFALLLSYSVRPHITLFLLVSFALASVLEGKLKTYQKGIFLFLILTGFFLAFDRVLVYLQIENLDLGSINEFANSKIDNLSRSHTESAVDIGDAPIPWKMFTFLYRPFFFDINGFLAILASFENAILLLLTFKLFSVNPIKVFIKADYIYKGLLFFFIIGVISFSLILGNLGIMLRQKNMFIPAFIYICLWAFSHHYKTQNRELIQSAGE